MFLAGGAGSGKTTGLASWQALIKIKDVLTIDGTFSDQEKAIALCTFAAATQHQITVLYVFCPIEKAIRWALDRAIKFGRILTLKRFAETHFGSQQTILRLANDYSMDFVEFAYIDNSGEELRESTLEFIEADSTSVYRKQ